MNRLLLLLILLVSILDLGARAQQQSGTCGASNGGARCQSVGAPCCSQFGNCGSGANFCGLGCQPSFSQSPNSSCFHTRPNILSTCTTGRFDFTSSTWLIPADYFTSGDPSEADFTLDSPPTQYTFPPTGGIQLKLTPPPTTGTAKTGSSAKLTSTFYLHYGRFAAQVRAACGTGVVTSFIAYSDDKDEIDLEWTGGPPRAGREILGDLGDIETNVFSKGIIDPTDSHLRFKTIDTGSNTCETTHTYEVLWLPDSIEWFLDGKSIRKYTAQENCNANYTESPNNCRFPVSPSKISFAVWDGGSPENAEGTNEGAGGRTEWTGVGEYVATFDWVEVQCFGDLQSARPTGPPARKEGFSAPSRVDPPAAKVSNVNNNKTQAGAGTDAKGTSNAAETGKGDGDGVGTQQQGAKSGVDHGLSVGWAMVAALWIWSGVWLLA